MSRDLLADVPTALEGVDQSQAVQGAQEGPELGARVGLSRNSANTAMALLESRNLVLRPEDRKYRTYYLHPHVASYASQEELEEVIQDAAERIEAGDLPEITAPAVRDRAAQAPVPTPPGGPGRRIGRPAKARAPRRCRFHGSGAPSPQSNVGARI